MYMYKVCYMEQEEGGCVNVFTALYAVMVLSVIIRLFTGLFFKPGGGERVDETIQPGTGHNRIRRR